MNSVLLYLGKKYINCSYLKIQYYASMIGSSWIVGQI